MKTILFPAIRLTLVCLFFFMGVYPAIVLGLAQWAPNQGKGHLIRQDGKSYYANIGQSFTEDQYFYSRPSAVAYNAAGAGGSNQGPSNPAYLATLQARVDTFLAHNPAVKLHEIPADLITASGSGLDPDISVAAAKVQVNRIAKIRQVSEVTLYQLIAQQTKKPLLGLFGPAKVNVLQLNLALDKLK
ncbi:MAG: K(+)-transporting ATPase subunit C [Microscillaceae bacterium]|nr:K(+)-transporting ATPase subunit C [Microscillaceae bacterium]